MKIGILTQPLHNNYGGLLQNFALQEVLRSMGHTVVTLDVNYQPYKISFLKRSIKFGGRLIKKIKGDRRILFIDVVKQVNFFNSPQKEQKRFIDKYIVKETFYHPLEKDFWHTHELDALVVGSDQVWRSRFSPYILNYFFDFAEGKDIKKISYAASFGVDSWDGGDDMIEPVKNLLQQFTAISVRESSGVDICSSVFGLDATLVLDPTLLLKAEDYKKIMPKRKNPQGKTCAIYVLDMNSEKQNLINKVCCEKELSIKYIGCPNRKGFPSLESWLSEILYCEYVITDSFHGTVFSILFQKQFTTIMNESRGAARFETLLNMLNLKERLVSAKDELIIDKPIDYVKVENILNERRKHSYEFISKNLCVAK